MKKFGLIFEETEDILLFMEKFSILY